jgi:hypothetical protein
MLVRDIADWSIISGLICGAHRPAPGREHKGCAACVDAHGLRRHRQNRTRCPPRPPLESPSGNQSEGNDPRRHLLEGTAGRSGASRPTGSACAMHDMVGIITGAGLFKLAGISKCRSGGRAS